MDQGIAREEMSRIIIIIISCQFYSIFTLSLVDKIRDYSKVTRERRSLSEGGL